jgi:hypothetical protein
MYQSTLDLPRRLISESRTSAPSYSQVSWLYQHLLTLYTTISCTYSPYTQTACVRVCTLYTASPRTYAPYTQPSRIRVLTLYTDNPCMPQKIGFSVNPRISSSTLRATLDVRHFRCIHKYLQEALDNKIDIQYVQVCS